ncbi:hypothetical protein HMPREF1990_01239 [Porphyromonas gingivalis W4087]|uniref:C25 family cysteine peptidase n=1 Tax=Porphyromonas gingivalis TaxID=837 RepID=UPI0003ACF9F4|nr:C25 family cysteine peptidase [Porphyromonas gingivalis]ATR98148.1 hypothetical protein CS550_02515 [Porphyromonas gingivalis]ERJ88710.1 hypothetical protein HMPREF1990_01239 [Porphyromonas gingivalis W4087]PDP63009.1 hypothetical protein CLI83_02750 [Porphyromonas gingivalis]PDP75229.1 hypothetical protein CLI79_05015 [Porphyromonas gingivalis]
MKRIILLLSTLCFFVSPYVQAQNEGSDAYYQQMFELIRSDFERDMLLPQVTSVTLPSGPLSVVKRMELQAKTNQTAEYVMIVVDKLTYDNVKSYIERYATDINNVTQKKITLYTVQNASHKDVKNLLVQNSPNLWGAVFIGDIPTARYEGLQFETGVYASWPCDLYYMDLNGDWIDKNGNNIFDNHTGNAAPGKNVEPEIFVGRISTKGIETGYAKLRKYFDKNHQFWSNTNRFNGKYSLAYLDFDWTSLDSDLAVAAHDIFAPGDLKSDYVRYGVDPEFGSTDYFERISTTKYDFAVLACHSSPTWHFMTGGGIGSQTIINRNVRSTFFNLFCCSACDWEQPSTTVPYLGGAYVYGNESGTLSLVGSTKIGSMLYFNNFNPHLGQGKSIGESLKEWWHQTCGAEHSDWEVSWFYGLTIVGDPLIFIPQKYDLMIKDNPEDIGIEPNLSTQINWNSPDIWVRNQNDDVLDEHQQPIYKPNGEPNYVYVRIRNNSKYTSAPDAALRVSARGDNSFSVQTPIGTIPAFSSKVLKFPWVVAAPLSDVSVKPTYTLSARINSVEDVLTFSTPNSPGSTADHILNNNNLARKRVAVLNIAPAYQGVSGYGVRISFDSLPGTSNYSIEFVEELTEAYGSPTAEAEVTLNLGDRLQEAWQQSGEEAMGISSYRSGSDILQINQSYAELKNISVNDNTGLDLTLHFNFLTKKLTNDNRYVYHVRIRDNATNEIVDGQTIVINKENSFDVRSAITVSENENPVLMAEEITIPASYNWYDGSMNLLAADTLVFDANQNNGEYILEVTAKESGFKDYSHISVIPTNQIASISPNPATNLITVTFSKVMQQGAKIGIVSAQGVNMETIVFEQECSSFTKDVSGYPASSYTVTLWDAGGKKVGSKIFVKQ